MPDESVEARFIETCARSGCEPCVTATVTVGTTDHQTCICIDQCYVTDATRGDHVRVTVA